MDHLEEMDRFLEKFKLPRLNQEEIEIMNKPITSTEFEAVITHVHPWLIHVNVWQNQYSIVKQNKVKIKIKKKISQKTKAQDPRWLHRRILSNI